jgi:FkbM family methyltransferase
MLRQLTRKKSAIDRFLDSAADRPKVILYGAGFAMSAILRKLESNGFCVVAICDSDTCKHGTTFWGRYPVLPTIDAAQRFPDARFVISSPSYFWQIHALLTKIVEAERIVDIDLECAHYFARGEFETYFLENLSRFEQVFAALENDGSREAYFRVLQAHSSGERRDFEAAFTGNNDWYLFKTLLAPAPDALYVDCGAYDGDTICLFLDAAQGAYRKVVAFEPDTTMIPRLKSIAESEGGKVEVITKGVSDRDGVVKFLVNGMYSSIATNVCSVDAQPVTISTVTLDAVLAGEEVSTIKMDIEGTEYDALKGAAKLIQRCRPKLAICLYHKVEDLVRIPELVKTLVPEYKLRIRHQSPSCTDTILFATLD